MTTATSSGPGLISLLTVLFIGLKLTGYIDWTWVWVLSPLWIGAMAIIAVWIIMLMFFAAYVTRG